jgi:glycoprotein endo-alpha-1,2-mannosidase
MLRVHIRSFLFAVIFCAASVLVCAGEDSVNVFAHYMPWFRAEKQSDGRMTWEHWEWFGKGPKHDPDEIKEGGRRNIASVYYPLIGPYDGRDPSVLEYHFLTARAAGIDGFIADWYGPGTYSDEVFALMVQAAEKYGMTVAICLEEKSFFPGYSKAQSRAEVLDEAERHIRHVIETHARSPAYLRENGRPVFYMFVNHQVGVLGSHILTPEEINVLTDRFLPDDIFFIRGHSDPNFVDVVDGIYGWVDNAGGRSNFYQQARGWKLSNRVNHVTGGALPGFDNSGVWGWGSGVHIIDRRGTGEYDEWWQAAVAYQPDAVQIATWNDFQEGSTIEPAEEYGFTFIDRTEEWVEKLNGRKSSQKDNQWPYQIYRLRQDLRQKQPGGMREKLNRQLDAFAADMVKGKRFFMSHRLKKLEKSVRQFVKESPGEIK